ncbi:hypothetical protein OEZ85_012673 [Tetradesmus obliquus]|uniref:Uncharacterized protein n=1 Tax=Tetradesmus obliquus TaxID=3088 RepID=A0ABY8U395_TETOB|nr:hypothetical protein OEZ85_012673 [Tetradesmus obliquus]
MLATWLQIELHRISSGTEGGVLLQELESNNSFTAAQRAPKHQALDPSTAAAAVAAASLEPAVSGGSPRRSSLDEAAAGPACGQDSLQLDIQVLAPVIPEEYPEEDPASPLQQQQQAAMLAHLQAAREAQQQQQHGDRAFFAKVAAWEAELVGMLEQQAAPLAIRQIVSVFKDRINTERDKTEFKAICDKWTSVVECPVGSGTKCLAIKSWMRGQL